MNKTGLMAKISIKYVLPTSIWKYFWRTLRYFAFLGEFRGISRKYLNFADPRPREISEALRRQRRQNNRTVLAEGEYKDVVVVVLVVVSISLFKLLTVEKGDYETCAVQNASPCQASS